MTWGGTLCKKVIRLRDELDQCAVPDDTDTNSNLPTPLFIETFTSLTEDDVCVFMANSSSCCRDPIPTPLLKSCIEPLIPVITEIINISLDSAGIFPLCWKVTVVVPLPKKLGLDSVFKNLRPVSNLACISKLTERAVFNQMHDHLVRSGLYFICCCNMHIVHITARRQR